MVINLRNLLIWDIDGTLIQGWGIGRRNMDRAFLEVYGIPEGFDGIGMSGRLDSAILGDALTRCGLDDSRNDVFFSTYCRYLQDEASRLTGSLAAPGIPALLEALAVTDSFDNVLGTGNIEGAARIKLAVDNLNRHFPAGGYGDLPGQRWEVIKLAWDRAEEHYGRKYAKNRIYVIGDTPRDIECGKLLGVKSIGVATGSHSLSELRACRADHVFEDLADTEAFLAIFDQ